MCTDGTRAIKSDGSGADLGPRRGTEEAWHRPRFGARVARARRLCDRPASRAIQLFGRSCCTLSERGTEGQASARCEGGHSEIHTTAACWRLIRMSLFGLSRAAMPGELRQPRNLSPKVLGYLTSYWQRRFGSSTRSLNSRANR